MKTHIIAYSRLLVFLIISTATFSSCDEQKKDKVEPTAELPESQETAEIDVTLSPILPFDVAFTSSDTVMEVSVRRAFDRFSWESFVALNWSSNPTDTIGSVGDNETIWETWKNSSDIFLPDGSRPSPWGTPGTIPTVCTTLKGKFLVQVGKTPDLLNELELPFKTGPLIDQNGKYTRFEILVNEEMFNYIDTNTLYSFDGQQVFDKDARFPKGSDSLKTWGAIMVKGAWKVLGKNDDSNRFHTVNAVIYTPASGNPVIEESCFTAKVGLVGLHIGTKTDISPQWVWSTFEQVDNVPTFGEKFDKNHYNYFNASAETPINEAPARPWNPNIPNQIPTQVERLTPIDSGTAALNAAYQAKLKGVNKNSVWQYYQLVGTQWPVHPDQVPLGDPFPQFLGNAVLETYIQGIIENDTVKLVPNVSTSCMHCHNGATMISNGKASDFTFLLERAN